MPAHTITYPLMALTLMLWLIWSDSVRSHRPSRIVYVIRGLLFLAVAGMIVMRMLEAPALYSTGARVLVGLNAVVGLVGAGYFIRKAALRVTGPPGSSRSSTAGSR
jgi:hypothetical protein